MNGKDVKLIRGQLRQIVKEELVNILISEVIQAIENKIVLDVNKRLDSIKNQVEDSLKAMDKKVSDGVSYLVRHTGEMPLKVKLNKSE